MLSIAGDEGFFRTERRTGTGGGLDRVSKEEEEEEEEEAVVVGGDSSDDELSLE